MLIWPGSGCCFMFAVAVGASNSLFCFPCLWASPQMEPMSCGSFICNPLILCYSPVDVVIRCGKGKAFYSLMIKSQSFSGSVSPGYDFHNCFLPFLLPWVKQEGSGKDFPHKEQVFVMKNALGIFHNFFLHPLPKT